MSLAMFGTITISRAALEHNARMLKALVAPSSVAFVVKANAYGHGLVATASAVATLADAFCVYALEEAVALYEAGIRTPIHILGPVASCDLALAYRIGAAISLWSTGAYVRDVARVARGQALPYPIHAKLNTGLNRLGLPPEHAASAIAAYLDDPRLVVRGIFSHLASAEEVNSSYTRQQTETFTTALAPLRPLFHTLPLPPRLHLAASAAGMLWPETRFDVVRFGIALYGLWPSPATREAMENRGLLLQPALTLRCPLVAVRQLAMGDAVGYGMTFHAPRAMRIGILPMGYADGLPRLLSNRGVFLLDGRRCPILGRIAMNMTVIDLSAVPTAQVGAVVTLIGHDAEEYIGADDWAEWVESINYEIVTRLPQHVPRILAV